MSFLQKVFRGIRTIRDYCKITKPDYFLKQQNRTYFIEDVLKSLRQIINIKFSQEKSLKSIVKYLHTILYYVCNPHVYDQQTQKFLQIYEEDLIMSTIEVLKFYREYLRKIVPNNVTYFHFLRDSQFYMHYTVVRYILIVSNSYHLRKITNLNSLHKIASDLKRSVFGYLIDWLSDLVQYRNSFVYLQSNKTISCLISSTFILVCGLLGKSYDNTFTKMDKEQKKDLFNKLMYIAIYILCDTITNNKKNKYFLISLSISCLRKMLIQNDIPDIDTFIPSYLYADKIGFIHCPLTYQVVLRVLISFLNQGYERQKRINKKLEKKSSPKNHFQGENELENHNIIEPSNSAISDNSSDQQQLFFVSPLTQINIWGVINLIIQKYGTYNKSVIEAFLTKIIPDIKPQSIIRAYCIKVIQQLDLDLGNHTINEFFQDNKFGYCIDGKLMSIDSVIKNFRTFMEAIYSNYIQQSIVEKQVVLSSKNIFKYLLQFNKDQIQIIEVENNRQISSPSSLKTPVKAKKLSQKQKKRHSPYYKMDAIISQQQSVQSSLENTSKIQKRPENNSNQSHQSKQSDQNRQYQHHSQSSSQNQAQNEQQNSHSQQNRHDKKSQDIDQLILNNINQHDVQGHQEINLKQSTFYQQRNKSLIYQGRKSLKSQDINNLQNQNSPKNRVNYKKQEQILQDIQA